MSDHTYGLFRNDINKRLIAKLEEKKADVRLFPAVEPRRLNMEQSADPAKFDWIIFCDPHSVEFFLAGVREKFELDNLRVCALGEAVADRLRFSQLHADVIPAKIDPGTVFSAIEGYESPANLRFLIPKESKYKTGLSVLLRNAGAEVEELPVYEIAEISELPRFRSLLMGGAIDEFIFGSPQDVYDLSFYVNPEALDYKTSAADEATFQTLREFNFRPVPVKIG
jgi:uroporphyrinogen-III synthase